MTLRAFGSTFLASNSVVNGQRISTPNPVVDAGDVEALALIVMMEATRGQNADLKQIMNDLKPSLKNNGRHLGSGIEAQNHAPGIDSGTVRGLGEIVPALKPAPGDMWTPVEPARWPDVQGISHWLDNGVVADTGQVTAIKEPPVTLRAFGSPFLASNAVDNGPRISTPNPVVDAGDVEALAFIVMMEATRGQDADLKQIMNDLKPSLKNDGRHLGSGIEAQNHAPGIDSGNV